MCQRAVQNQLADAEGKVTYEKGRPLNAWFPAKPMQHGRLKKR